MLGRQQLGAEPYGSIERCQCRRQILVDQTGSVEALPRCSAQLTAGDGFELTVYGISAGRLPKIPALRSRCHVG